MTGETVACETTPQGGVIRLMKWDEGYELWHHGRCVWREVPFVVKAVPVSVGDCSGSYNGTGSAYSVSNR